MTDPTTVDAKIKTKTFNFVAVLTSIVVLIFVATASWMALNGQMSWKDFAAAVGTPAGTLIGYWASRATP